MKKYYVKILKKSLWMMIPALLFSLSSKAQNQGSHLMVAVGGAYPRTLETTLSYERETLYHNAWEYFATCTIQYDEDPEAGHITRTSFWHNYNTWGVGAAYKPCVARGRNNYGNLRVGASAGSDTDKFVGGLHVGYEHNFALRHGWGLFVQAKCDLTLPKREDLFRTGIVIGFKIPTLKK